MAVCIAVVGKDNSPQFIWCAEPEFELNYHYKVHTSLDVIEEKLSNIETTEVRKQYLGLLHSTEEHKTPHMFWGFTLYTRRFTYFGSCRHPQWSSCTMMFKNLHCTYVDIVSNPFYIPGDPLVSKNFKKVVEGISSELSKSLP